MVRKGSLIAVLTLFAGCFGAFAQKKDPPKKYPSLLWEITGNGLKKPSYLFGTMHVSSKMVFHLSDSFYHAIKQVDVVALELNPDVWQGQMVRMDQLKQNYANYVQAPSGDFLNEQSFRINKYEDELKLALSSEPTVVNSLLYRSYKSKEDFEEDTFLDLYIFQTGKKLGKKAAGVEDYFETEKVVLEAYTDMAKEKKKKTVDTDGESMYAVEEKMQDAYRRGDLDLMDSLDIMIERSDAFREKFLYKRNEIQANSIDTIIRNRSLFVGVGAAHLPGQRGIIEILRKKGYKLRPIMMADRDAAQKDAIDKLKVPVEFRERKAEDGFYTVSMPGPLYDLSGEYQRLDRRQYSDMSNGSYYLVTRVKTYAAFAGQKPDVVQRKVDSILYENIPGKIITRKNITRNGYTGYDITNRTRRGDLQRYNIFITPFEVIMFKMSGKENYVDGKEAEQFFSSIQLRPLDNNAIQFEPKFGGFSIKFPHVPDQYLNNTGSDETARWEYQAVDKATGEAYLLMRKTVNNYRFLDEDTFDLSLVEESFRSPDYFDKQISRKMGSYNGYPVLDVKEKLKDGGIVQARFMIQGPHYYVLASRSASGNANAQAFINSFSIKPYHYNIPATFTDTFLHFSASTPLAPELDEPLRKVIEKATEDMANGNNSSGYVNYWPKQKTAVFRSDSTGENMIVTVQEYPKYYNVRDSFRFWKDELDEYNDKNDLVMASKDSFLLKDGTQEFRFSFRDTGSSRVIYRSVFLKDNFSFSLVSMGDTVSGPSTAAGLFAQSFRPAKQKLGRNIFENRLDEFFTDLFSKDSATRTKARQSISNIYYGEKGIPGLVSSINKLTITDKDYFESKSKLIAEFGYIRDSTQPRVVQELKRIYELTADTSIFQNEVVMALARHRSKESYKLLKELLLTDPPVFENSYDYGGLFRNLEDSLELTAALFPELLQLSALEDYKERITSLLVMMVDSNIVNSSAYESYYAKLYFDAKIELKKQQAKDEKRMEEESKKEEDDDSPRYSSYNYRNGSLDDYSVLLMPYYDKQPTVQKFFERLLQSKDPLVRLNAAVHMLRNRKNVHDSVLLNLAASDRYRGMLYAMLENAKRLDRFPAKYKNQTDIARSFLVADKGYDKVDSIVLLNKQAAAYLGKKGVVYFYKYRVKKDDDWKIGISGLQPLNEKEVSSDDKLALMTDKKLKPDEPRDEQFQQQLKKIIFSSHKSGKNFYGNDDYYSKLRGLLSDYDD